MEVILPDTTPPMVPGSPSASAVSPSRIDLSWTDSTDSGGSGLAGYKIERCTGSGCTDFAQIGTTASTSTSYYNNTGLTPSTTYRYRVRAYDNAGNDGNYSNIVSATTLALTDFTPPTGLSASDGTYTDYVQLSWNLVSGATGYDMWRNTANNSSTATKIFWAASSPQDDTTVTPGVTYYYWVKAKNGTVTSPFSTGDSGYAGSAPTTPPTGLSASDGTYTDYVQLSCPSGEAA